MTDKPNMYGIIPANVRYHEGLSSFAKIIFAEINALSNKNGYCFASNAYFEKTFGVTARTVSRTLTSLADCGAIKIKDGSGGELQRHITPCSPSQKLLRSVRQELPEGVEENVQHNNTSNNTTSITTNVVEEGNKLPLSGKSSLVRLVSLHSGLFKRNYGTSPTIDFGRSGKALKPLVEAHGEYKVALALLMYFGWKGANGDDEFMFKRLSGSAFPIYWLADHIDPILAYWRNVIKVDVDSPEQVKKTVDKLLAEKGLLVAN